MKFKIKISAILTALCASLPVFADSWEVKFFNPKPMDDDVILPMPCDGAMAFRLVRTGTKAPLEDRAIVLGAENSEQLFAEYATPNYIAGSFDKDGERYFLVAKYEVNQLQYQAVMNESCPKVELKMRLPANEVSWFDSVTFANKYSEWLLKNYADKLPQEDHKKGFVRLPTNTEWEFVARGGVLVSEAEFRDRTFPVPEGMTKYIWSSKNANGKLQLVGLLKPNPLGVFDMLGNVNEIVFDAFKANKLDRYHGQSGGIAVRGGSYLTSEDQMSSAYRIEQPYYNDQGQAYRAKDTGFRVVISAPVVTSPERMKQLTQAWQKLGQSSDKDQEIVGNLAHIKNSVESKELKKQLKGLEDALRASNQVKDEQRDRAIQSALRLGAFLCTDVADLNMLYVNAQKAYSVLCEEGENSESCPKLKEKMTQSQTVRDFVLNYYADSLVDMQATYSVDSVKKQVDPVVRKLASQNKSNLHSYVNVYWQHLEQYYTDRKIDRDDWLKSCSSVNQ